VSVKNWSQSNFALRLPTCEISNFLETWICFLVLAIKIVYEKSCIALFCTWMYFYHEQRLWYLISHGLRPTLKNVLQHQERGLAWCFGYLRTSFYSVQLFLLCLPAREREKELWAKLIYPSGTVTTVFVYPLFYFLPGCGLQERLKSQMHGHFVWGGLAKKEKKVH